MKQGKRCYYDDEEPEKEYVELKYSGHYCGFCGEEDHAKEDCPHRPFSDG